MAKLTAKARAKIPAKKFAGPKINGKPSFPVEDVSHAEAAERLAPRALKAGHITPMQEAMIDRKARAVIAKTKPKKK
jgi:hypothetical protein